MNVNLLLLELQNLDLQSQENARARADAEKQYADSAAVDAARADLERATTQLDALEQQLRDLELETGSLTDKLALVNERLYSGRITNAKELAGLNDDEKMLQKRKRELEDRALSLMEKIETTNAAAQTKRAAFADSSTQTNAQRLLAQNNLHQLDASDAELAQQRASLRARLDAPTLRSYDQLRAAKKGRAVAQIKNASCSQCGYAVPAGLLSRIKVGSELVWCANCGRILTP